MAVDDKDPITGRPIFLDSGAPDTGVDPTEVGKYAADVGNRIVRANLAGLDAYEHKRAGLSGHALDTGADYVHDGSGWQVAGGVAAGVFATAGGSLAVSAGAGSNIVFPTGRFTVPPLIFVTPVNNGSVVVPHVTALTKDGFNLRMFLLTNATAASSSANWFAVQKTASAAAG